MTHNKTGFVESIRAVLRRRLPGALLNLGAYLTFIGQIMRVSIDHAEVLHRTQRRMRAEGLVFGRDDGRARAIAAEELSRYRTEFYDGTAKFQVSSLEEIDPWTGFPGV